jgi:hypothetical protein
MTPAFSNVTIASYDQGSGYRSARRRALLSMIAATSEPSRVVGFSGNSSPV